VIEACPKIWNLSAIIAILVSQYKDIPKYVQLENLLTLSKVNKFVTIRSKDRYFQNTFYHG